jgi:hypothetical protein
MLTGPPPKFHGTQDILTSRNRNTLITNRLLSHHQRYARRGAVSVSGGRRKMRDDIR